VYKYSLVPYILVCKLSIYGMPCFLDQKLFVLNGVALTNELFLFSLEDSCHIAVSTYNEVFMQ